MDSDVLLALVDIINYISMFAFCFFCQSVKVLIFVLSNCFSFM